MYNRRMWWDLVRSGTAGLGLVRYGAHVRSIPYMRQYKERSTWEYQLKRLKNGL